MNRRLPLTIVSFLLVFFNSYAYATTERGTLNLVIAHGPIAVVATDSRATIRETSGKIRFDDHYQKLFKITDDIVITVAGYGSTDVPAAKELTAPVAGIVNRYVEELNRQKHTPSYNEAVRSLLHLLDLSLTGIASVNYMTNPDFRPEDYVSEVIIVGKQGEKLLITKGLVKPRKTTIQKGKAVYFDVEYESKNTIDKLDYKTAGMRDIAEDILHKPRFYQSYATTLFADRVEKDGGLTMTVSDLKYLAEFIMDESNKVYPGIGGQTQFAIFEEGRMRIETPQFPTPFVSPLSFNLATNWHIKGPMKALSKTSDMIFLFVDVHFEDAPVEMSKDFFFGGTFINCTIYVNDNSFHFDKGNKVINSFLVFGEKVDMNTPEVKDLLSNFRWNPPFK